jgi:hypothetical protein
MIKSPFLVVQDFLSADDADSIAEESKIVLQKDEDGNEVSSNHINKDAAAPIYELLKAYIPKIEEHFGLKVRGVEHFVFQQFPRSSKPAEDPHCENSVFKRKKWIKVKDRDLTGIIWLKDYKDTQPFDLKTEVYGGKLEFKVFDFSFQPQKGTLVVYPSSPHFISATSQILVGELQAIRIHICAEGIWLYSPENFKGDYKSWFSTIV